MESLAAAYGSDEEDEGGKDDTRVTPGLHPPITTLSSGTINCAPIVPDRVSFIILSFSNPGDGMV